MKRSDPTRGLLRAFGVVQRRLEDKMQGRLEDLFVGIARSLAREYRNRAKASPVLEPIDEEYRNRAKASPVLEPIDEEYRNRAKASPVLEPIDEDLALRIHGTWERERAVDLMARTYTTLYTATASATGSAIFDFLSVATAFNIEDLRMRAVIDAGGTRMGLVDLDRQTRDALFRALAEARAAGMGAEDTARHIFKHVSGGPFPHAGPAYRARMIARTETKFAQNMASLAAYRMSMVVGAVKAFDNQTGYGDGPCSARNGQEVSFDEAEFLTAREHPNGTLSWSPVVMQAIPGTARGRG